MNVAEDATKYKTNGSYQPFVHHRLDVAKIAGDPCAGLLLNLIVTWWRVSSKHSGPKRYSEATKLRFVRGGRFWIYKHGADWMGETGLTERRYKNALAKLKTKGLIITKTANTWLGKCTLLRLTDEAVKVLPSDLKLSWFRVPTNEHLGSWWKEAHLAVGLQEPAQWTNKDIKCMHELYGQWPIAQTREILFYTVNHWDEFCASVKNSKNFYAILLNSKWIKGPSVGAIYKFDQIHFDWLDYNGVIYPTEAWHEGGEADIGKKAKKDETSHNSVPLSDNTSATKSLVEGPIGPPL